MSDVIEILNNRENYVADGMENFTVDGVTYTNYSKYNFIWEKSYVKSPERSSNGSIGNLDTYSTFITPHMTATYSIMSIDDYRSIMKQYLEKNEFVVSCYDPIYNKTITARMYFATPSTPEFYYLPKEEGGSGDLIGVQNYTVELIGTNNPIE